MKKVLQGLVLFLLAAAFLFAGYIWLSLSWSYSTGERAGLMQKFSKKGWICKTWEGELLLTPLPGVIPEKFEFTVRDDQLAQRLSANAGKRLILNYSQHKGIPSSCFGDTEYFVDNFRILKD